MPELHGHLVESSFLRKQEMEEKATKLDSVARTIPLSSQIVCLMPVLVTPPAMKSSRTVDRTSLTSYMLRQPLQPGWNLWEKSRVAAGQQVSQERLWKSMMDPDNALNRAVVRTKFGVGLPHLLRRPRLSTSATKPVMGPTTTPLTMPPKAYRLSAQFTIPPIPVRDIRKGIYSLLERRWIPPTARMNFKPSPIVKHSMKLHDFDDKFSAPMWTENTPTYPGIMPSEEEGGKLEAPVHGAPVFRPNPKDSIRRASMFERMRRKSHMKPHRLSLAPMNLAQEPIPIEMKEEEEEQEEEMGRSFTVRQGQVCQSEPCYINFKQHFAKKWKSIVPVVKQLEKLLTKYAVPFAFIEGDRFAELCVQCCQQERRATVKELFSVMDNEREVIAIMSIPGRQFKGPDGKILAALKIQTTWRGHRDRADYLEYLRLRKVVTVIERFFSFHLKRNRIRQQMHKTYTAQLERFRQRAEMLANSWEQLKRSKHVVIHVPSIGFCKAVRETVTDLSLRQNTQMARLCEINDPNVDVIYVSPAPLTEEALQYYNRLLGLAGAIRTGQVEDQEDVSHRYKIVVPDILTTLQPKRMCLSSKLACCADTLKRISSLIRGRPAYMVTGFPHRDDLALSDALDVPVLCVEPHLAARYSTKSGGREIFLSAGVGVPPAVCGICHEQQLYESMTQLILDNLDISLWLLKLNDEFDGRGIGCCEVTAYLPSFPWVKTEAERCAFQWSQRSAQEAAFSKVLADIPWVLRKHTKVPDIYHDWDLFLLEFLAHGGVVEAFPPAHDLAALTVNLLLEPGGGIRIVTSGDQIHAESPLQCWGWSVPQCSMEPREVNKLCGHVARTCSNLGIVGYVKLDLVTFVHPFTLEVVIWGVDLYLGYSDSLAMFRLAGYLSQGRFRTRTHNFTMKARPTDTSRRSATGEIEEDTPRFCVMSCQLIHSNIALLHYPVFLQLCRARGIGFDIRGREGTLFTLIDSINREQIGMVTIGSSLMNALATFARQLRTIHEEVSTPNMQGISNFTGAIEEIESILSTIQQNIMRAKKLEEEKRRVSVQDRSRYSVCRTLGEDICS